MARFFIFRPIFAWVIAILILLGGAIALKNLPVAQYPAVAPPQIAFNVTYPGASAQVVEDTVIKLIEQQMNGIEHLLYMEASSELGSGTLTLTFEPGTDIDISSVEAQNRFWLYNTPLNYSAVMLVADALERAGRADRAALTAALAATDGAFTKHIMPYGPTRFVNGQNQAGAPVNTQVQDGDIKVIFPREFADAQAIYPVTG